MKDREKKIIFFIPTLATGGAERVMSELSLNLPEDIEQFIVLFEDKVSYGHHAKIVSLGVDVNASRNLLLKLFEIIRRIYRFRKAVLALDPDVVVSFLQANLINVLVGLSLPGRRYKMVISERTATSKIDLVMKGFYGFVNRTVLAAIYRRADVVIAVSAYIKDELIRMFKIDPKKLRVIYNPVDVVKISRLSQQLLELAWFMQDIPIIINVGRLTLQKNQRALLQAFAQIRKDQKCRLVILGDGELKQELQVLSQGLGVDQDVLFLGYQQNPFAYVARSTIFCLSSSFEGFPNALVEAMATGCPVVAFDCSSGPREILAPALSLTENISGVVKADYGLLIENGNDQALGEGLRIFLKDKALREAYRLRGQERVKDFSVQRTINAYLEVCGL